MPTRLPWRRLVLAIAAVAMSTLPVFLAGAAFIQLSSDIGLTTTGLGIVTAAFFVTSGVASAPLGRLVERAGWQRTLRWNVVASTAVMVAIPLLTHSTITLGLLLVVGGAAYGLTNPSANKALAEQVDPTRRGIVFGLKHGGIPVSTLLAGLAVPLLIVTMGWRASYLVAVALAPVVWILARNPGAVPIDVAPPQPDNGRPMTGKELSALAVGLALASGASISLSVFLVAGGVEKGLSEQAAGILLFAGSVACVAMRVVAGGVSDARRWSGFTSMAALMATGAGVFLLFPFVAGWVFALTVVIGFATAWGWPGLSTFAVINANPATPAASSAISQSGVFFGAGLSPVLIGWVIDRWSFTASWILVACFLLAAAAIVTAVGRRTEAMSDPDSVPGRQGHSPQE